MCVCCMLAAGELELKIPWKSLGKDPLYVTINEVYIVVGPKIGGCGFKLVGVVKDSG